MSCQNEKVSRKMVLYLEKSLSSEEYGEFSEHLANCTECRKELENLQEAVKIIETTSVSIKNNWVHLSTEEIISFHDNPMEIDANKRKKIYAHLKLCPQCYEEYLLYMESPVIETNIVPDTSMSEMLVQEYRKVYKKKQDARKKESFLPFPEFIKRFMGGKSPVPRFAYATMAVLLAIVIFAGILMSPSFYNVQVANDNSYIVLSVTDKTMAGREDLVKYLQLYGVPSKIDGENVLVASNESEKANGLLKQYTERKLLAQKKLQQPKENSIDIAEFTPSPAVSSIPGGGQAENILPPDLIQALENTRNYPLGTVRENKKGSGGEEIMSNYASLTDDKKDSIDFELGKGPVITAVSLTEEPADLFKTKEVEEAERIKSIYGTDMEERDRAASKIREDFRGKSRKVLAQHTDISKVDLYVTVNPALTKNSEGRYPIKAVKITISHESNISDETRQKIIDEIKKEINWQKDWDGEVGFASIKY